MQQEPVGVQEELARIHLNQEIGGLKHPHDEERLDWQDGDQEMQDAREEEEYSLAQAGQKRPLTGVEQNLEIEKLGHSSGDDDDELLKPAVATGSRDYSLAQTAKKDPGESHQVQDELEKIQLNQRLGFSIDDSDMDKSPEYEDSEESSLAQTGQKGKKGPMEDELEKIRLNEQLHHSSAEDDDPDMNQSPEDDRDVRDEEYSFAQTGKKGPSMQDELEKIHLEQELGHASGDEDPYMNKSPQDEDYSLAQAGQKRPATGEEQRLEIEKLGHSSGDDDDELLKPAVATDSRDYSLAQSAKKGPMEDELEKIRLNEQLHHSSEDDDPDMNQSPDDDRDVRDEEYSFAQTGSKRHPDNADEEARQIELEKNLGMKADSSAADQTRLDWDEGDRDIREFREEEEYSSYSLAQTGQSAKANH